ncbi:hypothetical protein [Streptomyces sp. NBC_00687]|uniref:hypothetical protein n=1 Tax=Streptomyces sp. NBC_00687 TaxID=2975807 RepID=UPI00225218C5|nr:hypothetical protein [Streptomyces sp. NBC_00687]MCX4912886.1 hypothetical protein [Streptomyces sp. NBC_00687]
MTTAIRKPLTQASALIGHAQKHGWTVLEQWTPPGYRGAPILRVLIGRRMPEGGQFLFRLEFHTDGSKPEKAHWRARTPRVPAWHNAPTVAAIRAVILANSITFPKGKS